MAKLAQPTHGTFHARDLLVPIVTLGFYGLRRFQPHALYVLTAVLLLAVWLLVAVAAGAAYDGGEVLVMPFVFAMAAVTFFRLMLPARRRPAPHR